MDFGARLRELRERRNMSQRQLADLIGTSRVTITRYEAGKVKPQYDCIVSISKALYTTTDYLLGATNNPDLIDNWAIEYLTHERNRLLETDGIANEMAAAYLDTVVKKLQKEIDRVKK